MIAVGMGDGPRMSGSGAYESSHSSSDAALEPLLGIWFTPSSSMHMSDT